MSVKIHVKNFQSIEDSTVFIDNLTTIAGPNNTGKSALMRAITGVFTNMSGDSFVRKGTPHCEVTVTFEDGQWVKWEKGKKVNRYTVNGTPIDKVGRGHVPKEVQDLGVRFVPIGDGKGSDNKIWPQLAPQWMGQVFLLDRSGSVLAEAISDTDRVGRLNRSLRGVEADYRTIKSELKIRRGDEKKAEEQLLAYVGLDAIVEEVENLEDARANVQKICEAIKWLVDQRELFQEATATVAKYQGLGDIDLPPDSEVEQLNEIRDRITTLENLKVQLDHVRSDLVRYEDFSLDLSELEQLSDGAKKAYQAIQNCKDLKETYLESVEQVNRLTKLLSSKEHECDEVRKTVKRLEDKLKESKKKCPTCGNYIENGHKMVSDLDLGL